MAETPDRKPELPTGKSSRVTDEKAWRQALGDDGFFQDVTDEVVSKGIGGFILTGLPEPEPGD